MSFMEQFSNNSGTPKLEKFKVYEKWVRDAVSVYNASLDPTKLSSRAKYALENGYIADSNAAQVIVNELQAKFPKPKPRTDSRDQSYPKFSVQQEQFTYHKEYGAANFYRISVVLDTVKGTRLDERQALERRLAMEEARYRELETMISQISLPSSNTKDDIDRFQEALRGLTQKTVQCFSDTDFHKFIHQYYDWDNDDQIWIIYDDAHFYWDLKAKHLYTSGQKFDPEPKKDDTEQENDYYDGQI